MNFSYPYLLFLLFLIMPFIGIFIYRVKKFPKNLIGNLPSVNARLFGFILFTLSFTSTIIALSEPYTQQIHYAYKDFRIFFLLDISKSMAYAEDIKPNRLEAAKKEIEAAYIGLDGVYQTGMVLFSGEVNNTYCPLTYKKNTFLSLLKDVDVEIIDAPGTDLTGAFAGLKQIAERYEIDSGTNVVLVLSDGGKEDNATIDKNEISNVISSLRNFKFYSVGIGGTQPTSLVKRHNGKFTGYYVDDKKNELKSELDEEILRFIAATGNGTYVRFDKMGVLKKQIQDIAQQNRIVDYSKNYLENTNISHWFYGMACFFITTLILVNRKC